MPKGAVSGRRTALLITRPYSPVHSDRTVASIPSRAASSDWTPRPADVKWAFYTTRRGNPRLGYLGRRYLEVRRRFLAGWLGRLCTRFRTVALDLDAGKLNWYFQEAPSDPYDYDPSPGEYVLFESNGQKLMQSMVDVVRSAPGVTESEALGEEEVEVFICQLVIRIKRNGECGIRTRDLRLARAALSQLS